MQPVSPEMCLALPSRWLLGNERVVTIVVDFFGVVLRSVFGTSFFFPRSPVDPQVELIL